MSQKKNTLAASTYDLEWDVKLMYHHLDDYPWHWQEWLVEGLDVATAGGAIKLAVENLKDSVEGVGQIYVLSVKGEA